MELRPLPLEMAESSSSAAVSTDGDHPTAKTPPSNSPSLVETPSGRRIAYEQLSGSAPGVVYIHGLCSNMNSARGDRLADYCKEKDVCYLRFDLSGHGRSSEAFEKCNISMWLEDITAILETLTQEPQVIVGDGLGAWLMFLYTMRNPDRVFGLVGVAPAADFTQRLWKGLDKSARSEARKMGRYPFPSPVSNDPVILSVDLIVDGEKHSILDMPGIELIKTPTWLLHGAEDTLVPPNISIKLMQRMQCPVELKVIEGGDHQLNRPEEVKLLQQAIESLLSSKSEDLSLSGEQEDDED